MLNLKLKSLWFLCYAKPETNSWCYTEFCPPCQSPVSVLRQHGECGVGQIPPSEINTGVSLLQDNTHVLEVC